MGKKYKGIVALTAILVVLFFIFRTQVGADWHPVPLRTQAQKDAGLPGGEGMQMVFSMSYAPSNSNVVYLAVDTSQVWKSIDGGYSWQSKRRGFRSNGGVSLAVDPLNENVVFVSGSRHSGSLPTGTSTVDGIYRTLDGGDTWQLVKQTAYYRGKEGQHFAFDPRSFNGTRHQTIYAGTHTEGLLKSSDGGDGWVTLGLAGTRILDLEINANVPGSVFLYVASTGTSANGLYKVIDDGINPVTILPLGNLPDYPRTIALVPNNNPAQDILYAAVGAYKVYKSTDGGNTFVSKNNGLTVNGREYRNITVSHANPEYLYVSIDQTGARQPFYSHDGGVTWQQPVTLDEGNLRIEGNDVYHSPIIATHPADSSTAIGFMSAAITITNNGGISWRYSGNGYMGGRRAVNKTSAYFDPANPQRRIYFLVDYGPALTENGGDTWRLLDIPRINNAKTTPVGAVSPNNPNIIIAPAGGWTEQKIIRTTDAGQNWTIINNSTGYYRFMCFHPQNSNYVYAGAQSGSWISQDNGQSWTFIPDKSIRAVSPQNGDVVYAFEPIDNNTSRFWRSNDKGSNWLQVAIAPFNFSRIRDVDIDSRNPNLLYVAAGSSGLYVFNGTAWIETGKSKGIPVDTGFGGNSFDVMSVVVDPVKPNIIYAGMWATGLGHREKFIFRSSDSGNTWEDIGYNLEGYSTVWSLAVDPTSGDLHMSIDHGNYVLPGIDVIPPAMPKGLKMR